MIVLRCPANTINCIDRANLSAAVPATQRELAIDAGDTTVAPPGIKQVQRTALTLLVGAAVAAVAAVGYSFVARDAILTLASTDVATPGYAA
jgi:hypothetical protein